MGERGRYVALVGLEVAYPTLLGVTLQGKPAKLVRASPGADHDVELGHELMYVEASVDAARIAD